jgi:hypothetical protein
MNAIADASGDVSTAWSWVGWSLLALTAVAVLVFLTINLDPAPTTLADEPEPEPFSCNAANPHVMLPTPTGWRCANDCGEAWYVDPNDDLATADLALWELESGWVK